VAAILIAAYAFPQQSSNPDSADKLKSVLDRLDRTAAQFRSAQANFVWDTYQKAADEHDKQQGKVYFRRKGIGMEMAAYVTSPAPAKTVLYEGGKVQLYQAGSAQVDVYDASKNNGAVESFLVLGFGGSGQDMLKSFDVTYGGSEKIDGADTDKLDLVPKSDKVKGMFNRIELWVNSSGISVQQKLLSPEGDYRFNHYTNIVLDKKIPDSFFKLKTSGNVQIENH
jgi:outer membrane lipoprotein-sorting protein